MKIPVLFIILVVVAGCTKSRDGNDISVTVSDEYKKQHIEVVDDAVQNYIAYAGDHYTVLLFTTDKDIPQGSVASVYDKNNKVLRICPVYGSFAQSIYYKIENPSSQYRVEMRDLDARLIYKVIIGQPNK